MSDDVSFRAGTPRPAQLRALRSVGLTRSQRRAFFRGELVVFDLPTDSEAGMGKIQLAGARLRCGIVGIEHVGGGLQDLARFREHARAVARVFGAGELELFGESVLNERVEAMLLRRGFTRTREPVPQELGGGSKVVLWKVFRVG